MNNSHQFRALCETPGTSTQCFLYFRPGLDQIDPSHNVIAIQQVKGMKDINGTMIYEVDIVE